MRSPQPLLVPEIQRGECWAIVWYHQTPDGRRVRVRKSRIDGINLNAIPLGDREAVAQQLLSFVKQRLQPATIEPDQSLFIEALWEAVALKRSAKRSTNKSFCEVVRWISEFFAAKGWQYLRCNQVTQEHIQAYFDYCIIKLKVANSTHNTRKNNLRSIFAELVTRKYFAVNYVAKVPERPTGDPKRRPLLPEEKALIARHIKQHDPALTLAFVLLGYLAIRPGEIRDLRVSAIDLKRGVVWFPASQSKNNRDSTVTIPKDLLPYFEGLKLDRFPSTYYLFGKAKGRHNCTLLPQPEPIGINTLSARFRAVLRLLKSEGKLHNTQGIQFYSLKDTLAIMLLDDGIDVESAMRHFRHRDLAVFQRYVKRLGVVNEKIRGLEIDIQF